MSEPRFRLRGVAKAYRSRWQRLGRRAGAAAVTALAGVDLDLDEGQVSALLGCSGAGKSTLARIIIGFDSPDSGQMLYRGQPVAETPRSEFRRCNQLVFQNPYLAVNPLFSVERIIAEPLRTLKAVSPRLDAVPDEGALKAVSPRLDAVCNEGSVVAPGSRERIAEVMEWLQLPEALRRRRPHELSGGELQRVALARALAPAPEFLVLDEPFSALDDLTAMRILMLLKGLFRRLGLGALFVSHHPRHVRALADRVAVLENGRIAGGLP